MAALPNPKQEKFCQLVAKGEPIWRAYRDAGYASKSQKDMEANGFRLYRQAPVRPRIRELQLRNAAKLGVSVDTLVKELDGCLRLARKMKHPAAAIGAVMGKAKLLGLITDKSEVQATVVRKPMRTPGETGRMSMEDWKQQFAPKLEQPETAPQSVVGDDDEDAA